MRRMEWTAGQRLQFGVRVWEFRVRYGFTHQSLARVMNTSTAMVKRGEGQGMAPSDEFVGKFDWMEERWRDEEKRGRKRPLVGWTI